MTERERSRLQRWRNWLVLFLMEIVWTARLPFIHLARRKQVLKGFTTPATASRLRASGKHEKENGGLARKCARNMSIMLAADAAKDMTGAAIRIARIAGRT